MADETELSPEQIAEQQAGSITDTFNPFAQNPNANANFIPDFIPGFSKTAEEIAEEAKLAESQKGLSEEEKAIQKQEIIAAQQAASQDEDGIDPVDYLNDYFREGGFKINSIDDIIALNNAYQGLLAKQQPDLSAEEQARLKLGRETGDWTLFDKINGFDTNISSPEEIIRTKIAIENSGKSQLIINTKFDRYMRSLTTEDDSDDVRAEIIKDEADQAKKWLEAKKSELIVPVQQQANNQNTGAEDIKWHQGVDSVLNLIEENKRIVQFEMNINEEDKVINVPIDSDTLLAIRDAMDSPQEWLKNNILNDAGTGYDFEKLGHLILKVEQFPKIIEEYYQRGRTDQEAYTLGKQRGSQQGGKSGPVTNEPNRQDAIAGAFQLFK